MGVFGTCLDCSEKGWRDCSPFRPDVLAVMMLCSACWSSPSARRDRARHGLFMWVTSGSMKGGADRMHPDTSRRLLFRAASVCPICQCHMRRLGGTICSQLLGTNAMTGCYTVSIPFSKGKTSMLKSLKEGGFQGLFDMLERIMFLRQASW